MTVAQTLSAYASDLEFSDLDEAAIEAAKIRLLDSLACSFAGIGEAPVEGVLAYAKRNPGTEAPVLSGGTASVENATLANGTLIRYADWNDSYFAKEPAHPSDNFGAILSVAGMQGVTGKELLTATVLAYEIQSQLCDAAALRSVGLDHVTYGLVSAGLSVGSLQNHTQDQLTETINIGLSSHVSLRQIRSGEVSIWKGMAFANAARNAVFAADMATEGITGPSPIFEGRFGLDNLLIEPVQIAIDEFGGGGTSFKVTESSLKLYPLFQHAQSAVNCAVELRETTDLDIDDIVRIENESYEIAMTILDDEKWDPRTRETADHSQPYCIARALIDGTVTLDHFQDDQLTDPDVQTLIETMEITERPSFTDQYGEKFPHFMRIHTSTDVYETTVHYPKGSPHNPLSESELIEKFSHAAPSLSRDRIEKIIEYVDHIEQASDVSELFEIVEAGFDEVRESNV